MKRHRRRAARASVDRMHDVGNLAGAENRIDFGNLAAQLVAIALGQAAGDDEPLTGPVLLELVHLDWRVLRVNHKVTVGADDLDTMPRSHRP